MSTVGSTCLNARFHNFFRSWYCFFCTPWRCGLFFLLFSIGASLVALSRICKLYLGRQRRKLEENLSQSPSYKVIPTPKTKSKRGAAIGNPFVVVLVYSPPTVCPFNLPYDAVMSQLQALLLYFPVSVLTSFGVFCHCI